jgi:endo-1,4-beta-D-glucanase Y
MNRRLVAICLNLAWLLAVWLPGAVWATPRYPFPQHVSYAQGSIRPNHVSQAVQDDDVRNFYQIWKSRYLAKAGTAADGSPLYRIAFGKPGSADHAKTVSEGQGYGMVTVALMAGYDAKAQAEFDGLWNFVRRHPSVNDTRLMAWQVPTAKDDTPDSAFDGDADIAYSLLLAAKQWGNNGKVNYRAEALKVIAGIRQSTIGPNSFLPLLGDWVNATGSGKYNQWTPRSSDFMLANFRAFRQASGNASWDQVIARCQSVASQLQAAYSPGTGLLPDFIVPLSSTDHRPQPAPAQFLEGPYDGQYYYNAGRVPWRLGFYALLTNNAATLNSVRKLSHWAEATTLGNPQRLKAGYYLNGSALPGSNYFTSFFAAPLGVAAMADASQQNWLNYVYDSAHAYHEGYYEDSVTLLCLLIMSGNFWDPALAH